VLALEFAFVLLSLYINTYYYYYYYYYYYVIVVVVVVVVVVPSSHRPFLPRTSSVKPAVMPTAQASSFSLQYFLYYTGM
jgi:hypothetical protein